VWGIVLEDPEPTILIADQVDAADTDIGLMAHGDAAHHRAVVGVAQNEIGRDDAVL
jgi:hypothetical protein